MATVTISTDASSTSYIITTYIEKNLNPSDQKNALNMALRDIAGAYAEQWLVDNLDKIYERLNVDAIANMIMVEVAKQTKDNITSKEKK